jgi:hypothetical protein
VFCGKKGGNNLEVGLFGGIIGEQLWRGTTEQFVVDCLWFVARSW